MAASVEIVKRIPLLAIPLTACKRQPQAVRLALLFRRQAGMFNGETFREFLKVFRDVSVVPGRRVLAISDNAQYHRSKLHLEWRGQQAPQFGLDFLPPYSPDLNPIERVWKLGCVFTIATSDCWMASLPPSKIGSLSGPNRTIPCANYAIT